jgi:pimeloyl-ACP methyl ester carboxylesterase
LIDHLQISSANILGWSMGGLIAQSLAMSHPERLKHLVLLGSFAAADGMLKNTITNWVNIRRSNMPYEQVVRHVAQLVYSPALANNEAAYEAYIQNMVKNPYRQPIQGFVRQAEGSIRHSFQAV